MPIFNYKEAFSRNIGWVTESEQHILQAKKVAIAGMGGVGGTHLIVLSRMGIGKFHISDLDNFELANFNRQYGALISTIGLQKSEIMEQHIREINPEIEVNNFKQGITMNNIDEFLSGVDLYLDSLDIFALQIRREIFKRCYERGIPAITAAPMGMGTAMLTFLPGKMRFDDYFDFDGHTFEEQILRFIIGVSPTVIQRTYLVDKSAVNFFHKKVPSTAMGIELAAGVACTTALKLLLGRGKVYSAPFGVHFDAYRNKLAITWRPYGNKNPLQTIMFYRLKRMLDI